MQAVCQYRTQTHKPFENKDLRSTKTNLPQVLDVTKRLPKWQKAQKAGQIGVEKAGKPGRLGDCAPQWARPLGPFERKIRQIDEQSHRRTGRRVGFVRHCRDARLPRRLPRPAHMPFSTARVQSCLQA